MEYLVFVLKLIIIYEMSYNFFSVYKNSDNKMWFILWWEDECSVIFM